MAKKQNQVKLCLWTHVQDEALIIKEMLASVVDYIDYWVIVDNGSVDGTQKVITDFFEEKGVPGKLYQSKIGWKGHGINRQHSWDFLCDTNHGCDYILRLDADEGLLVDDDFDWSLINGADSYNVIFVSGSYSTPRTWLWNFNYDWYWQDDEAHETIHRKDGLPMTQVQLPFSFRQTALSRGQSYNDPIKYVKDVLKLEVQLHERFRDGSNIEEQWYHLWYLCRSFNYTGFYINDEWAHQFFPYGRDGLEMFLKRGIYYYDKLIENFDPTWTVFYFRALLYRMLNDGENMIKDLETAHREAPHRAEPVFYLFEFYKNNEDYPQKIRWATVLSLLELDVERDPYDLELDMYPDNNNSLKDELEKLLLTNNVATPEPIKWIPKHTLDPMHSLTSHLNSSESLTIRI
jgi:glycosyltransferase involved in cell wall biosynthesis